MFQSTQDLRVDAGTKCFSFIILGGAKNSSPSIPGAPALLSGKKFPNYASENLPQELESVPNPSDSQSLRQNCLGKELLLCCEIVPEICRSSQLHDAKSLKTKDYCDHIVGHVHASLHADCGRNRDSTRIAF